MKYQLKFGGRSFDFTLYYQDRKSLGIKVHPDGTVEVLAPVTAKKEDIAMRIRQKAPWILKQIDQFSSYRPATPPRRFINGETHLYLGRQYRLKIVQDDRNIIKAYRGELWMHTVNNKPEALKEQLNKWYKERANEIFNELLEEALPEFKRYKIVTPILTIRFMSKRWGSCTPKGKITLNTELIKAPKGSIAYVIIHELCHLVHHNHTSAFRHLLNKMMPDWGKWKDRLEYGLV